MPHYLLSITNKVRGAAPLTDPDIEPGKVYELIDTPASIAGEFVTVRLANTRGPDHTKPAYFFRPFEPSRKSRSDVLAALLHLNYALDHLATFSKSI